MNLSQFEAKYNIDNGWIGPYQRDDGRLMVSKHMKKPSQNRVSWHSEYFTIYKCKYCSENALSTGRNYDSIDGMTTLPVTCSRYSECFSKHAGIQIAKDHIIHTRENPGIDSRGYYCWRVPKLDKHGNKISTGDGNQRDYVYMHRIVMEEHLGRKLNQKYQRTKNKADYEIVHHIDMNKLNNNLSNLWLCSVKDHTLAHASYNEICVELMVNYHQYSGIGFNRKTGKYYLINKAA